MLVDLVLKGKDAVIVGGGKEPEFKAVKLLDSRARITVLAESFTPGLRRLASKNRGSLRLERSLVNADVLRGVLDQTMPRVVFISTGDGTLDASLAAEAKRPREFTPIVCVVDDPKLNDFNMPAIAAVGDIRVGVSTGGKSPAMAGVLKRKIEGAILPEEVLQVRLQGYIRGVAKERLKSVEARKEFAYKVIEDKRIIALLKKKDYPGAKRLAEKMLKEAAKAA